MDSEKNHDGSKNESRNQEIQSPNSATLVAGRVDVNLVVVVSSSNGGVQSHSAPKYTTYRPNLA